MSRIQAAWKLFRIRKDGTLGPLFINRSLVIEPGIWLPAEEHPTKGYAYRPGWHATPQPHAPHLSENGRVWRRVLLKEVTEHHRPESQGGTWYLAEWMKVLS